jgi:site-specific DNA recombinase
LDAAVWADVCAGLQSPQMLRQEYERRLFSEQEPGVNIDQLDKQIRTVQRSISRLIDAYEDGLLERSEFEAPASIAQVAICV